MRHAAVRKRRDANEKPIIAALRAVGATVVQLSSTDVPDLLVGYRGLNWLLEVKSDGGDLSQGQADWFRDWRGEGGVVRTPEDALRRIGISATRK